MCLGQITHAKSRYPLYYINNYGERSKKIKTSKERNKPPSELLPTVIYKGHRYHIAYKYFNTGGGRLIAYYQETKTFKIGSWLKEEDFRKNANTSLITSGTKYYEGHIAYQTGFHAYTYTKEDEIQTDEVIRQVLLRKFVASDFKEGKLTSQIVAKEMLILPRNKEFKMEDFTWFKRINNGN